MELHVSWNDQRVEEQLHRSDNPRESHKMNTEILLGCDLLWVAVFVRGGLEMIDKEGISRQRLCILPEVSADRAE